MLVSHRWFGLCLSACLFVLAWQLNSAPVHAGIFSGEIKSVAAGKNRIVIETGAAKTSKSLKLAAGAVITLNDKTVDLQQIPAGTKVSVFTDKSGAVTKIIARTASTNDTDDADTAESTTDEPADDSKSTRTKSVSRKSSRKSRQADDENKEPVADAEWHQFRGPKRDGHSLETGLLAEWPSGGPALVYEVGGLGEG
ncbi:MAG: hypothetical protein WD065_10555, partial [Planctomycetaceae bacterium]